MKKKLKQKQIVTLETKDEIYSPKLGIIYREIEKNYSYEILLASTEMDLISNADIIIPMTNSDLEYSITVHANMIFPVLHDALFIKDIVGEIDEVALSQIEKLRGENANQVEITFELGNEIIFHSDRRYSLMLRNLNIVNMLGTEAIEVNLAGIPDNIVPLLTFKSREDSNIIESLDVNLTSPESRELLGKVLMVVNDKGIAIEEILKLKTSGEETSINIEFDKLERAVLVA
jgi:hypothetical protein